MKKIILILAILMLLAYIINSVRTVYDLWKKQELIANAKRNLVSAQAENKQLQNQLKTVQDPNFIENEARNKLFLTKPGEYTVFLPTDEDKAVKIEAKQLPNWQQWISLFLN